MERQRKRERQRKIGRYEISRLTEGERDRNWENGERNGMGGKVFSQCYVQLYIHLSTNSSFYRHSVSGPPLLGWEEKWDGIVYD